MPTASTSPRRSTRPPAAPPPAGSGSSARTARRRRRASRSSSARSAASQCTPWATCTSGPSTPRESHVGHRRAARAAGRQLEIDAVLRVELGEAARAVAHVLGLGVGLPDVRVHPQAAPARDGRDVGDHAGGQRVRRVRRDPDVATRRCRALQAARPSPRGDRTPTPARRHRRPRRRKRPRRSSARWAAAGRRR